MMNEGVYQETEGKLSPWLRTKRIGQVAPRIPAGAVVWDLACGAGYLGQALAEGCTYYGVDRVEGESVVKFSGFCATDLSAPGWSQLVRNTLNSEPDVITALAFLEHLKDYTGFIRECLAILPPDGVLLGTTPHPVGRLAHDVLARLRMCSRHGAEEHETFLNRNMLAEAAEKAGGELVQYKKFLFGLNQFFMIARKNKP